MTLAKGKFIKLPLKERTDASSDTRVFRFALPTDKHILGLPVGQHLFIKLKSAAGETVMRAYTPMGCGEGYVDFVIKVYFANVHPRFPDGGKLTQLLDKLQVRLALALGLGLGLGLGVRVRVRIRAKARVPEFWLGSATRQR